MLEQRITGFKKTLSEKNYQTLVATVRCELELDYALYPELLIDCDEHTIARKRMAEQAGTIEAKVINLDVTAKYRDDIDEVEVKIKGETSLKLLKQYLGLMQGTQISAEIMDEGISTTCSTRILYDIDTDYLKEKLLVDHIRQSKIGFEDVMQITGCDERAKLSELYVAVRNSSSPKDFTVSYNGKFTDRLAQGCSGEIEIKGRGSSVYVNGRYWLARDRLDVLDRLVTTS